MKKVILIIILIIVAWFILRFVIGGSEDTWMCVDGEWVKHGVPSAPKPTEPCGNAKTCVINDDCVVFGEDGDCNCGCFNKDYNWKKEGDCFCAAPKSCKCVNGACEDVFEEEDEAKLSYNIGGCKTEETREYTKSRGIEEKVDVEINDEFINLTHHLNYVCCADMKVYLDSVEKYPDYTLIKLREKNEGEMCRCICDYEIDAKIGPFESGKYLIQIWGIEFQDMPVEVLWEDEILLNY